MKLKTLVKALLKNKKSPLPLNIKFETPKGELKIDYIISGESEAKVVLKDVGKPSCEAITNQRLKELECTATFLRDIIQK